MRPEKSDSHLHIRVATEKKARYVKAAQREKMKLSEWVIRTLDQKLEESKNENS